jgi:transketolase
VAAGWERLTGDAGRSVSLEHYGASADYATLYREFGFTPEAVMTAARHSLSDAEHGARPGGHPAGFAPVAGGTGDRPA